MISMFYCALKHAACLYDLDHISIEIWIKGFSFVSLPPSLLQLKIWLFEHLSNWWPADFGTIFWYPAVTLQIEHSLQISFGSCYLLVYAVQGTDAAEWFSCTSKTSLRLNLNIDFPHENYGVCISHIYDQWIGTLSIA